MILHLGLIETQLLQFLDLEQLPQRDEQAVLPHLAVVQNDFATAGKRIRICRLALRIQASFKFTRHRAGCPASFDDNFVCLHFLEFDADREGRILGLRLHRETAADLPVAGARGDLRKIESVGFVKQRRLKLLKEEAIAQRGLRDRNVTVQIGRGAEARTEIDVLERRHAFQLLVQKTEARPDDVHALHFGRECRRFVFGLHHEGRRRIRERFGGAFLFGWRRRDNRSLCHGRRDRHGWHSPFAIGVLRPEDFGVHQRNFLDDEVAAEERRKADAEPESLRGEKIGGNTGLALGDRDSGELQSPPRGDADPLDAQVGAEALAEFLLNPGLCPARLHIHVHAEQNEQRHAHDQPQPDQHDAAHFLHAGRLRRRGLKKRRKPVPPQ